MTDARAQARPFSLAGLPLARWAFGIRVWVAMMLALYVAFWLELDGASSAAVCVAILALPTRGQAFEKALYRFGATFVGVCVSILISGLFPQERDLFVVGFAGWLGLCVFGANLLDGNRAYGVILSGYTVSIVSVMHVDSPGDVFSAGINRGAAIAIGIAAVALVNDFFAAPDAYPKALGDIEAARRRAVAYARDALRGSGGGDEAAAGVFTALTALHPAVGALATESTMGGVRATAARSAIAACVEEVIAARAMARVLARRGAGGLDALADALGDPAAARAARDRLEASDDPASLHAAALAEADRLAAQGLADMRAERRPERRVRLPLFRSRRLAARKAVRVGLAVAFSAVPFVYSSWPDTSIAFSLIGILGALGSTSPSPKGFALGAIVALPIAVAVAGVTEFVVLGGVDGYPLLCIAMAPPVIGACLLLSSSNSKLSGIGFLNLVFVPVIVGLANPQKYDPLSYLVLSLMLVTAVLLLLFWLTVMSPATDAQRRLWFLRAAAADLRAAAAGRGRRLSPAEAAYRSADRIGQIAALGGDPDRDAALGDAFLMATLDTVLRRARRDLAGLDRAAAAQGYAAVRALDAPSLRAAASRCRASAGGARAAARLLTAGEIVDAHRDDLRRLAPGLAP